MDFIKMEELLTSKKLSHLKEELRDAQAADVAEFIDELDATIALLVFRLLPKEMAADVFAYLSSERQSELCMLVNDKELAAIIDDLYFDDKIDLLEEMPANVVKKILRHATETERRLINQFLNYPEDSAGSLMTIEFVDIKKEMLVKDALERVRKIGVDKETIYTCYVTDAYRKLDGIVSLKDLVLAPQEEKINDIMQTDIIYVDTYDDQEDIADIFKKYDLLSVPVVDQEKRLVGIITIDDIVDVIEQETTEDIHRMAALEPSDEEYMNAGVFGLAKKRIFWLIILMISATLTEYIIQSFEATLASVVALAAFIPMLMGTGGNAGAQAATLIIRSITLGEIEFKDIFKVVWKELRVSFFVGIGLASVNLLRIHYLQGQIWKIAFTVVATMACTVMLATVMGGILPIIAKKIKLDPAIMASPMISTIVDASTLLVYFSFAKLFFGL